MGFRNPFRLAVDKSNGVVYVGDYGPDSGTTDPNRGPDGQVEFNRITKAGQLRLAVLHRHEHHHRVVQQVHLPQRPFGCQGGLRRRTGQQLAAQHGTSDAARAAEGMDQVRR